MAQSPSSPEWSDTEEQESKVVKTPSRKAVHPTVLESALYAGSNMGSPAPAATSTPQPPAAAVSTSTASPALPPPPPLALTGSTGHVSTAASALPPPMTLPPPVRMPSPALGTPASVPGSPMTFTNPPPPPRSSGSLPPPPIVRARASVDEGSKKKLVDPPIILHRPSVDGTPRQLPTASTPLASIAEPALPPPSFASLPPSKPASVAGLAPPGSPPLPSGFAATHSVSKLNEIFDSARARQTDIETKVAEIKRTGRRSSMAVQMSNDAVLMRQVHSFWHRFDMVVHSPLAEKLFHANIQAVMMEARQAWVDMYLWSKLNKANTKTIVQNEMMLNLIRTIEELEQLLLQTEMLANQQQSNSASKPEDRKETHFSYTVDTALLLWHERMDVWERADDKDLQQLLESVPLMKDVEKQVRLMARQTYAELDIVLFIADLAGKAAMNTLQNKSQRHKFFNSMWAVFSAARGSAWANLKEKYGIDLSTKLKDIGE